MQRDELAMIAKTADNRNHLSEQRSVDDLEIVNKANVPRLDRQELQRKELEQDSVGQGDQVIQWKVG